MRQRFFPIFLVLIVAGLRIARRFGLLELPPNFAPVTAVALFAGTYIKDRRWAIALPLVIMFCSDLLIGFYDLRILIAVYGSFAISGFWGFLIRRHKKLLVVVGATLGASISFYLLTNLAVWLFSGMYALTAAGIFRCYLLALPFFRNTLLGDLFYVSVFFGLAEIIPLILAYKKRVCKIKI